MSLFFPNLRTASNPAKTQPPSARSQARLERTRRDIPPAQKPHRLGGTSDPFPLNPSFITTTKPHTYIPTSPSTTKPCKPATPAWPRPSYPSARASSRARRSPCTRSAACASRPPRRRSGPRMRRPGVDCWRLQDGGRVRGGRLRGWGGVFLRSSD